MSQSATPVRPTPAERTGVDPRSVVINGVTTFAWYAVPDVVRPRWARALAKTAVVAAGAALGAGTTREGAEARAAVCDVRDGIRSATVPSDTDPSDTDPSATAPDGTGAGRAVAATVAVVGGMAVAGTLAVLGERWIYRFAERLRGRGVRAPHTAVGLVLGAAAAGLAVIEAPVSAEQPRSAAA